MKVACIQTAPRLLDKGANVHIMCEWIEKTMIKYPNTQLIVFPELSTTGYQCEAHFEKLAEDISDPNAFSISKIKSYAKRFQVHIVYGFPEKETREGTQLVQVYNSQILINQHGEITGVYRKIHLFDSEKKWFSAGDTFKVLETDIGKIGLFICYDAAFPEVARILTLQGADVLINSTNWEKPYDLDMAVYMQARALENTIYLICCNRIGTDTTLSFFGQSCILNPLGQVMIEQKKEVEDVLIADLDMDHMKYLRSHYYTMLQERRTDTYI